MRKTVIALMLVFPMLFVLLIYGVGKLPASLHVDVAVDGIRILADGDEPADGSIDIDFTGRQEHVISARVSPANASQKGYVLESDNPEVLTVDADGRVKAVGEGTAHITATSKDKGFTDSLSVFVYASLPYDVEFSLSNSLGDEVTLVRSGDTYRLPGSSGRLDPGTYYYSIKIRGGDSREYSLTAAEEGSAFVNNGAQSIFLPYGGNIELNLAVNEAYDRETGMTHQTLNRTVRLNVQSALPQAQTGIVVNGVADGNSVHVAKGTKQATLYVECATEPDFVCDHATAECLTHKKERATSDRHVLQITVDEGFDGDDLAATLVAGDRSADVMLSFADFDFDIRSDNLLKRTDEGYNSVVLRGTSTGFYAVPIVDAQDVSFLWSVEQANSDILSYEGNGARCAVAADAEGQFLLTVRAMRGEQQLGETKTVTVVSAARVSTLQRTDVFDSVDRAERYTVAGQRYSSTGTLVDNDIFEIPNRYAIRVGGETTVYLSDWTRIEAFTSDPDIATVETREGKMYLIPHGTGAITLTARWIYDEWFDANCVFTIRFNIVKDAVAVDNYPDLVKATDGGYKVVLTRDIMLGTYANGGVMSINERQRIVDEHTLTSTYNTEFYRRDNDFKNTAPVVHYAIEFTNDVYGNGFTLNAEYIANAQDASGKPLLFTGPLHFVVYKAVASVAGQDNISFLIRTDGVKLYGVNLQSCSNDSLKDDSGQDELNRLNNVGTTLEINADCDIINCRIRNGRNVVRAYGGNKAGDAYYITGIPAADLDEQEQIRVNIEGCIITHGREFLVKLGANKALQAGGGRGQEPTLIAANGAPYRENGKTNNYTINDSDFFYCRYVMTDVTLANCVFETSGLFCIGVESNFSGALLYDGAANLTGMSETYARITQSWRYSGGTSFASVLRLKGDVRLYDWKDTSLVDSSTLIQATEGSVLSEMMKFDISAMLQEVDGKQEYEQLIYRANNKAYVHGGIAFYGGGRNYSQIDLSQLNADLNDLTHLNINIGQFTDSKNAVVARQAELLPLAAGTHDFNFWMYSTSSANSYTAQQNKSYAGVKAVPLFTD